MLPEGAKASYEFDQSPFVKRHNLFVPLALAVGFAMVASYLLSSTLVPALAIWVLQAEHHTNAADPSRFDNLRDRDREFLPRIVRRRWIAVPAYLAAAGLTLFLAGGSLGRAIFPAVDSGQFTLRMRAPAGTRERFSMNAAAGVSPGEQNALDLRPAAVQSGERTRVRQKSGPALEGLGRNTVTRADLLNAVYDSCPGLSRAQAKEIFEMALEEVAAALIRGEPVKLRSFGLFTVREKSERVGRNPRTGIEVPIARRKVVTFKPSPVLCAAINGEAAEEHGPALPR